MTFPLGADEQLVKDLELRASLIAPWLKGKFTLTNKRLHSTVPKALFGLIPTGSTQLTQPLRNIANVGAGTKFSLWRAIIGTILVIGGLASLGDNAGFALVLIILGAVALLGILQAEFEVTDNSGGSQKARVAITEKQALLGFVGNVNQAIADIP